MLSEKQQKMIEKRDTKVLGAIRARKSGASMASIVAKTKLEKTEIRGSLNRLRKGRKVRSEGISRWTVYFAK